MINKAILLRAASALLVIWPMAAHAQNGANGTPNSTASHDPIGQTGDATEIVVTATKSNQPLDRAPISGATLSSKDMAKLNVETVRDAQIMLPSVVYNDSGGSAQVYIRGIGTNSAYAGLESSIGTYQDGVYLQRQVGASLDVVDLRNLEVLNGPQGSLYGRNATGGVILISTNDPSPRFEGSIKGQVGSYGAASTEGVVNVPLSDDLSFRLAGQYAVLGGYVTNIENNSKLAGFDKGTIRAKLGWKPTSQWAIVASVEYHKESDSPVARRLLAGAPICAICGAFGQSVSNSSSFYQVNQTPTHDTDIEYIAGTVNVKYDSERFYFASVTGIRNFHYGVYVDQDYAAADYFRTSAFEYGTTLTQDMYFRSKFSGPINVLAGLSGEIDKDSLKGQFYGMYVGPLAGATSTSGVKLKSISPYGEIYVKLPEFFKLTIGGRFNVDTKTLNAANDAATVLGFGASALIKEQATFRDFTPRVVLSHETRDTTIYASVSKGAKSGGFNTPVLGPLTPLQPEDLTSYEAGFKANAMDGRIHVSADGFYYNYTNIQVSYVDAKSGTVVAENAASARVYGFEFNGAFKPAAGLTLNAGVLIENARFRSYTSAAIFCPAAFTSPGYAGCPAPTGGAGLVGGVAVLSGTPLPRAPDASFSLAANYDFKISGNWTGAVTVADRYTSSYDFLPGGGGPLQLSRQPAYHFVTSSLTLADTPAGLAARIFVENLTGSKYYLDLPTSAFGVAGSVGAPRTFGVSFSYSF